MTEVGAQLWLQNNGKKKQYDVIIITTKVAVRRDKIDLAKEGRMIDYADKGRQTGKVNSLDTSTQSVGFE